MTVPLRQAAEVLLGRQRAPEYEQGDGQTPYLRSANIKDGRLDLSNVKAMRFSHLERLTFGLQPGDVLVTEGSGSRDSVGACAVFMGEVPQPVCFQNTLLRLRPRPGTLGRYLAWWTRHAHASGLLAAVASGANILHVGAEVMGALPITVPPPRQQQRIADFLDDQVACLDAAGVERQRLSVLLLESAEQRIEAALACVQREPAPLGRLLRHSPSYGVLKPEVSEAPEAVPLLRIMDLDDGGGVRLSSAMRISHAQSSEYSRTRLRRGDVIVSVVGTLGRSAVVGDEVAGANISRALARLVLRSGVDPRLVQAQFSRHAFRQFCDDVTRATAQSVLNMADLTRFQVVVPDSAAEQAELRVAVDAVRQWQQASAETSTRVLALIEERKRALITACVTGEFDVTTASTRAAAAALHGVS